MRRWKVLGALLAVAALAAGCGGSGGTDPCTAIMQKENQWDYSPAYQANHPPPPGGWTEAVYRVCILHESP